MLIAFSPLDAARTQMAVSFIFHIFFVAFGIGLPAAMSIAEYRANRTGDPEWMALARTWARGFAILFAVGAVSGTILSISLPLFWPRMMGRWGSLFGFPFMLVGSPLSLGALVGRGRHLRLGPARVGVRHGRERVDADAGRVHRDVDGRPGEREPVAGDRQSITALRGHPHGLRRLHGDGVLAGRDLSAPAAARPPERLRASRDGGRAGHRARVHSAADPGRRSARRAGSARSAGEARRDGGVVADADARPGDAWWDRPRGSG
ncbi:MAG: cytochrome ubiquinol oxidase subunit I [Actinobacteria bacterium]|nr:MAG: cytochrome ubiquinol oxidase subunit I [Actinomycetota bacterium]